MANGTVHARPVVVDGELGVLKLILTQDGTPVELDDLTQDQLVHAYMDLTFQKAEADDDMRRDITRVQEKLLERLATVLE
jgi:hypothetical protein